MFLLDLVSAVFSQFHLKWLGAYGRLLRAVRLKWSTSLVEERGCQSLCCASWHRLVWMCVIKPTQCCLRRLGVKVVSQLFCKNRAVVLAGFLWCWCAQHYIPLLSVVDLLIIELIKGLIRHFTFTCSMLFLFLLHEICKQQSLRQKHITYRKQFAFLPFFFWVLQVYVKVTPTPVNKLQNGTFIIFDWSPATHLLERE